NVHSVCRGPKGNILSESWKADKKMSVISYAEDGKVTGEMRTNGEQVFGYYSNIGSPETIGKNVNARHVGMIFKDDYSKARAVNTFEGQLDQFLKSNGSEVVKQEPISTASGAATRFEVKDKHQNEDHQFVTVDSKTGLIVAIVDASKKYNSNYDYPASIDQSIFEPAPQIIKNCLVVNWLEMEKRVQQTVENGIAHANGVTLRLVSLDTRGYIWAVWTGKNVSEQVSHPFTASGIRLGKAGLLPQVTTGAPHYIYGPEVMRNGERLYGMYREAITKVGDTTDISVPTKGGGFVKFKSIPILRIGLFEPSLFVTKKK
ncbi:MAG: hypothetical protein WCG75_10455, partial [Armatimonadota bacterium]